MTRIHEVCEGFIVGFLSRNECQGCVIGKANSMAVDVIEDLPETRVI